MSNTAADRCTRIVIADSHPSIRENLRYLLDAEADLEVIGVAKDAIGARTLAAGLRPDVLVIDYELSGRQGLSVACAVRAAREAARVILYTMTNEVVTYTERARVDACVNKAAAPSVLLEAIRGIPDPVRASRPRVVVVEAEADVRSAIRVALEASGFEMVESTDGFQALAACERYAPKMVILDLRLLRMSGQEFATAYHRLDSGIAPLIVVSVAGQGREAAAELGAAAWLSRPFSIEELSQAVRAGLEGPSAFAFT